MSKQYKAELTITQAVADASHGGVIYYFCHIHSKMSGKIRIQNTDGTAFTPTANPTELDLYTPEAVSPVDGVCGTSGIEPYSFGKDKACSERFICGTLDTDYEKCLDAMNCEMKENMHSYTSADHSNEMAVFMQQMIPHHKNAINMVKVLMKQAQDADTVALLQDSDMTNIMYDILAQQSYQIHQFRNYLGPLGLLPATTAAPTPTPTAATPGTPAPTPGTPAPTTAAPTPTPTSPPAVADVQESSDSSATLLALSAVGLALSI
jgi:hypothetical protein